MQQKTCCGTVSSSVEAVQGVQNPEWALFWVPFSVDMEPLGWFGRQPVTCKITRESAVIPNSTAVTCIFLVSSLTFTFSLMSVIVVLDNCTRFNVPVSARSRR